MTYSELLSKATTWTARHVAQDELMNFGHKATASQYSIDKVNDWQVKEGGAPIQAPITSNLGFCNCCGTHRVLLTDEEMGESICQICHSYDVRRAA